MDNKGNSDLLNQKQIDNTNADALKMGAMGAVVATVTPLLVKGTIEVGKSGLKKIREFRAARKSTETTTEAQ